MGDRSNTSYAAALDEVEVKIQRWMAALTEDIFVEEEVQRRLAKDNEPAIKEYGPDANKSTHAKPSVMLSTGNSDEYSGDMNLDKEQFFQYSRDVHAVGVKKSLDSIMPTTSAYPDSQVTSNDIASTKTIVVDGI